MVDNKKCLICGQKSKRSLYIALGEYKYTLCGYCKGATLEPREKVLHEIKEVYTERYFHWKEATGFRKLLFKIQLFKSYADWVNETSNKGGRILDVGAGITGFVDEMKRRGWKTYALEISKEQSKKLKKILGVKNVYVGDFENLKLSKNFFDVLTFWHVFEHVRYPIKTLEKTREVLKKGGLVFMEFPNLNSINLALFKKYYAFMRVPEHLFYYNEASLRKTFKKQGFKIIKIIYPYKFNSVFAASIAKLLEERGVSERPRIMTYYLFLPISLALNVIASIFGKTDIMRVVARKV